MDIDFDPAPITPPIDNEWFNSSSPESINLSPYYSSSNAASAPQILQDRTEKDTNENKNKELYTYKVLKIPKNPSNDDNVVEAMVLDNNQPIIYHLN